MSRTPTSLEIALTGGLFALVRSIESLPDDELDPDMAVKMLEDVAAAVGELSAEDRDTFIQTAKQLAEAPGYDWDARSIEQMLVGLNLMEPSDRSVGPDPRDPPPPPPLPPDLDDRIANIRAALARYMGRDPGE